MPIPLTIHALKEAHAPIMGQPKVHVLLLHQSAETATAHATVTPMCMCLNGTKLHTHPSAELARTELGLMPALASRARGS